MNPERFVTEVIRPAIKDEGVKVKFGTIPADYSGGLPRIIFDGESTASVKRYPHLASYAPAANERVMLLGKSGRMVVVGTPDEGSGGAESATVATSEATTSTAFTDLTTPGPAVTLVTGAKALVIVSCALANGTAGETSYMGYAVSGATILAPANARALAAQAAISNQGFRISSARVVTGLTPGSNTFTAKYQTTGGTGSFSDRQIVVIPL